MYRFPSFSWIEVPRNLDYEEEWNLPEQLVRKVWRLKVWSLSKRNKICIIYQCICFCLESCCIVFDYKFDRCSRRYLLWKTLSSYWYKEKLSKRAFLHQGFSIFMVRVNIRKIYTNSSGLTTKSLNTLGIIGWHIVLAYGIFIKLDNLRKL